LSANTEIAGVLFGSTKVRIEQFIPEAPRPQRTCTTPMKANFNESITSRVPTSMLGLAPTVGKEVDPLMAGNQA
jgi:hypothetical protein